MAETNGSPVVSPVVTLATPEALKVDASVPVATPKVDVHADAYLDSEHAGVLSERARLADLETCRDLGRKAGERAARAEFRRRVELARAARLRSARA